MRHLFLILSLSLCLEGFSNSPVFGQSRAVDLPTTVILVRHAERAPGEGDVPISAAGRARAQTLAQVLRDTDIQTIITSQMLRTKETAEPLAQHKRITPDVIPADKLDAVVEKIRSLGGGTVLVVHHSNTVPALIEKLGGATPPIRDSEFDRLVILTILQQRFPSIVTLRYGATSPP